MSDLFVDGSLARGAARQFSRSLAAHARQVEQQLLRVLDGGVDACSAGRPNCKVVRNVVVQLNEMFCDRFSWGWMHNCSGRRYQYALIAPYVFKDEDESTYSIIVGELNGRKPIRYPQVIPIFALSGHATQRLFQRLRTLDQGQVIEELRPSVHLAPTLWRAAEIARVERWPIETKNGFFIAARAERQLLTSAVTWIPKEGVSTRWRRVLEHLNKIPRIYEVGGSGEKLAAEVLKAHTWLRTADGDAGCLQTRLH
ncbi:MAG: hypothetical protein KF755_03470 [Burkholderiaceae bacterium]|nr:hypothetical protein [Burkholderiaceae bacterium]